MELPLLPELQPIVLEQSSSCATSACLGLASKSLFQVFKSLKISWEDTKRSICEDGSFEQFEWAQRELGMTFSTIHVELAARLGHTQIVLESVRKQQSKSKKVSDSKEFNWNPVISEAISITGVVEAAAAGGHLELVDELCKLEPIPHFFQLALNGLASGSNLLALQKFMATQNYPSSEFRSAIRMDKIMSSANLETVSWLLKYSTRRRSYQENSIHSISRYLSNNFGHEVSKDEILSAMRNPDIRILSLFPAHLNLEAALHATEYDNVEAFSYIMTSIDAEYNNIDQILSEAAQFKSLKIVDILLTKREDAHQDISNLLHLQFSLSDTPENKRKIINGLLDRGFDLMGMFSPIHRFYHCSPWTFLDLPLIKRFENLGLVLRSSHLHLLFSYRSWTPDFEVITKYFAKKGIEYPYSVFANAVKKNFRRSFLKYLIDTGCKADDEAYLFPAYRGPCVPEPYDPEERYFALIELGVPLYDTDTIFLQYVSRNFPISVFEHLVTFRIPWTEEKFITALGRHIAKGDTRLLRFFVDFSHESFPLLFYLFAIKSNFNYETSDEDNIGVVEYLDSLLSFDPSSLPDSDFLWTEISNYISSTTGHKLHSQYYHQDGLIDILQWFSDKRPISKSILPVLMERLRDCPLKEVEYFLLLKSSTMSS